MPHESTPSCPFKVGDLVKVPGIDGPVMKVYHTEYRGDIHAIYTFWFDKVHAFGKAEWDASNLVLAEEPGDTSLTPATE